jgi:FMN-dependent NADH-azoreductase
MLFLTTRGGALEGSPMDNGTKYLSDMATFFGIPSFAYVAADGLDLLLEPPEVILERAIMQAKELAKRF